MVPPIRDLDRVFLQVIIAKFFGEKDAAYWRTQQMVEVLVLKEAMAKVGMRMEWLEKKQTPDMKLYHT